MTVPVFASLAILQLNGLGSVAPMMFTYGAIFAIFYFVLIRPQQKQKKQHDELIRQLKKGDEIVTAGGVVGEVVFIAQSAKDGTPGNAMEDRITIKSGESRLIIERGKLRVLHRPLAPDSLHEFLVCPCSTFTSSALPYCVRKLSALPLSRPNCVGS